MSEWLYVISGAAAMWIIIGFMSRWSATKENAKRSQEALEYLASQVVVLRRIALALESVERMLDDTVSASKQTQGVDIGQG